RLKAGVGWDGPAVAVDVEEGTVLPIPGRKRPWGLLVAHPRPGSGLGPEDLQFLQSVVTLFAVAVERDREQRLRRRTEARQEKLQRGLWVSAQEWRLTFDALTHPLLLIDFDGTIVRLNR